MALRGERERQSCSIIKSLPQAVAQLELNIHIVTMAPAVNRAKAHPPMTPNRELTFLRNRRPKVEDMEKNLLKFVMWRETLKGVRSYVVQGQGKPTKVYCTLCGKNICSCLDTE